MLSVARRTVALAMPLEARGCKGAGSCVAPSPDTCLPADAALVQVMDEENYDGPDITYYFDTPDKPPHGPDDDEGEDSGPTRQGAEQQQQQGEEQQSAVGEDLGAYMQQQVLAGKQHKWWSTQKGMF